MPSFQEQLKVLNKQLTDAQSDVVAKTNSYNEAYEAAESWRLKYEDCRKKRSEHLIFPNKGCHIDTLNSFLKSWDMWATERDNRLKILNSAKEKVKQIEKSIEDTKRQAQAAIESDPAYQIEKEKIASEERSQKNKTIGIIVIVVVLVFGSILIFRVLR